MHIRKLLLSKYTLHFVAVCSFLAGIISLTLAEQPPSIQLPLAQLAMSPNKQVATAARQQLRARGQEGLNLLLAAYLQEVAANRFTPVAARSLRAQELHAALDEVAGQLDAELSGLFWYTDLAQAKKVARAAHKPIISLRLLGNLTDELSCANSRFFRTLLYPNPKISDYLRKNFVLHWQSERSVPKITIDYGDGRQIETTITGNSVHYVLDAQGRPLDAIPGLYSPHQFLQQLQIAYIFATTTVNVEDSVYQQLLRKHHSELLLIREQDLNRELEGIGKKGLFALARHTDQPLPPYSATPFIAEEAAPLAITKSFVERPLLSSMRTVWNFNKPEISDSVWHSLGMFHIGDITSDPALLKILLRKHHDADLTVTEQRILRQTTIDSIATDTAINEFMNHSRIRKLFIEAPEVWKLESLNEAIYISIFLTPKTDPWLGLISNRIYSGIESGGMKAQ